MDSRKLGYSLMMLVALIALGTIAYTYIEGMPFFDAFYMTIITISTVGFSEIVPLTKAGRSITVVIIILGISVGTYTVGIIVQWLVSGEIQKIFGRRKLQKQIADLKNHFIICGFGRIGQTICQELFEDSINFVVIEQDHAAIEEIISLKYLFIEMDATAEDALLAAGIMNAKGLVAAVNSDANNVFITLTAKGLRPDIFVMARTSE
jgi:voltage-gated potassium channel